MSLVPFPAVMKDPLFLLYNKSTKVASAFSLQTEMNEKQLIPATHAVIGNSESNLIKVLPSSSTS